MDKVLDQIRKNEDQKYDTVITDVRFSSEFDRLCDVFGSKNVIGVKIVRADSEYIPPDKELENQPLVDKYIDYMIEWETEQNLNNLIPYIREFEGWLADYIR